jgi:Na+/melibiose symporter-like transporter
VLALRVKVLTGSSGMAGAVILAVTAPALLAPALGWAVDRLPCKPFLVWVNLLSGAALLPLLAVHGAGQVWLVYLVALAYGFSFSLKSAGMSRLLKGAVPDELLADANGALRSVREGSRLLGPLAGAGLFAWAGITAVVLVDLATFLAAAATVLAVPVADERAVSAGGRWAAEAAAGFRHLFADPVLRRCTLAVGVAFLLFGTVNPGAFDYVDKGLHRPPEFVGVLMTVMGAGAALGALCVPRLIRRLGEARALAVAAAVLGLGLAALLYPRMWLGFVAAPVIGLGVAGIGIAFATLTQRRSPGVLLGRVSTATDLLVGAPQTASIAAGAVLVSVVDYRWLFATAAAALLAASSALWTTPATTPNSTAPNSTAPSTAGSGVPATALAGD